MSLSSSTPTPFPPFESVDHYMRLHRRLTLAFERRGCPNAEDIASEALLRLIDGRAVPHPGVSVDLWAFGIARNVWHESLRRSQRFVAVKDLNAIPAQSDHLQDRLDADRILSLLNAAEGQFLKGYFESGGNELARRVGLTPAGVRSRVIRVKHRIRTSLARSTAGSDLTKKNQPAFA